MKKIILISILSIMFAGSVSAQSIATSSENSTSTIAEKRNEIKNAKENVLLQMQQAKQDAQNKIQEVKNIISSVKTNVKEDIKGKKTEIKIAVQEVKDLKTGERINKIKESAVKDFDITVKNLDNLGSRIDSRIGKFEASGTTNMTEARDLETIASAKIDIVRTAVESFKTEYSTTTLGDLITNASSTNALVDQLKNDIIQIKNLIKDAHSALVDVVNSIIPEQNDEATTTK